MPRFPGAIQGIAMPAIAHVKEKATPYLMALMDEGVLALSAGPTLIGLLPPPTISQDAIDVVIASA